MSNLTEFQKHLISCVRTDLGDLSSGGRFHERAAQYLQGVQPNVISRFNNGLSVFWYSTRLDRLAGVLWFEYCIHYYFIIYFLLYNLYHHTIVNLFVSKPELTVVIFIPVFFLSTDRVHLCHCIAFFVHISIWKYFRTMTEPTWSYWTLLLWF
jgi:hypothetical protein